MANADRLTVTLTNSFVDPANFQQIGFALTTPAGSDPDAHAQILAYLAAVAASGTIAGTTQFEGMELRSFGSAGNVPVVFPQSEYDALTVIVAAEGYDIPGVTDYAGSLGVGQLAPLGTSVSVSEVTATVGRTGRGRHFLPYISENCVTNAGSFGNATVVLNLANLLLLGKDTAGDPVAGITVLPVGVCPSNGVGIKPIVRYKPQLVFSNLESRRR